MESKMNKLIEKSHIYYNYGLKYLEDNQISKAKEMLLKSITLYNKDIETLNLLGIICYILCDFDKANYYWSISHSIQEDNNRALHYLSILESQQFKLLVNEYNQAIDLIDNSNYEEAITKLKLIINMEEELIEPYAIIGVCYLALNEYALSKSFIEKALEKDKNNERYLQYLVEINELNTTTVKPKLLLNNKMIFSSMALLIIIVSALYLSEQRKHTQAFNRYIDYEQKYINLGKTLNEKETELKDLKDRLIYEQNKWKEILEENLSEIDNKYLSENEYDLFKKAYENLLNSNYEESIEKFKFIAKKGIDENIVAESLYFLSVSYERQGNYSYAKKYYEDYIQKYKGRNYYDDSLYSYGLLLYRQGNVSEAKEVLHKLKTEIPNSIFNNSKIEFVLNN
jgi:TolA-binding protein